MANDLNRVVLIGRLTRDPELRSTSNGSFLCRFSLASNRSYTDKDGQVKDDVGYFECVTWGKSAEIASKYLKKGKRVCVDGTLKWSQWDTTDGKKQSKIDINVESFQFLDPKGSDDSSHTSDYSNQPQASTNNSVAPNNQNFEPINDEDIPF